jgi:hypothetical protein
MKLHVCLISSLIIASAATALAETTPAREVSVGYSFMREEFEFNRHGWVASYAENVNRWFGVKAELGGNYIEGTADVHSILAGPQLAFTRRSRITPWSQFLLGTSLTQNRLFLPFSGLPPGLGLISIPTTYVNFAMQPGGGVDFWLGSKAGIRLGADYRRVFRGNSRRDLDSFRLQGGVVFRLGSRSR